MVAAAESPVKPRVKARLPNAQPIPLETRLKAKNLYLIKCLEPSLVAKETGLTRDQVSHLADREGWVKIRKARIAAAKAALDAELESASGDEIADAVGRQCDELTLKALDRTAGALDSKGEFAAKDAQSFSSALRNIVQVGRIVRGKDSPGADQVTKSVNLMFFMVGREPKPDPVNVTPSLPLASAPLTVQ